MPQLPMSSTKQTTFDRLRNTALPSNSTYDITSYISSQIHSNNIKSDSDNNDSTKTTTNSTNVKRSSSNNESKLIFQPHVFNLQDGMTALELGPKGGMDPPFSILCDPNSSSLPFFSCADDTSKNEEALGQGEDELTVQLVNSYMLKSFVKFEAYLVGRTSIIESVASSVYLSPLKVGGDTAAIRMHKAILARKLVQMQIRQDNLNNADKQNSDDKRHEHVSMDLQEVLYLHTIIMTRLTLLCRDVVYFADVYEEEDMNLNLYGFRRYESVLRIDEIESALTTLKAKILNDYDGDVEDVDGLFTVVNVYIEIYKLMLSISSLSGQVSSYEHEPPLPPSLFPNLAPTLQSILLKSLESIKSIKLLTSSTAFQTLLNNPTLTTLPAPPDKPITLPLATPNPHTSVITDPPFFDGSVPRVTLGSTPLRACTFQPVVECVDNLLNLFVVEVEGVVRCWMGRVLSFIGEVDSEGEDDEVDHSDPLNLQRLINMIDSPISISTLPPSTSVSKSKYTQVQGQSIVTRSLIQLNLYIGDNIYLTTPLYDVVKETLVFNGVPGSMLTFSELPIPADGESEIECGTQVVAQGRHSLVEENIPQIFYNIMKMQNWNVRRQIYFMTSSAASIFVNFQKVLHKSRVLDEAFNEAHGLSGGGFMTDGVLIEVYYVTLHVLTLFFATNLCTNLEQMEMVYHYHVAICANSSGYSMLETLSRIRQHKTVMSEGKRRGIARDALLNSPERTTLLERLANLQEKIATKKNAGVKSNKFKALRVEGALIADTLQEYDRQIESSISEKSRQESLDDLESDIQLVFLHLKVVLCEVNLTFIRALRAVGVIDSTGLFDTASSDTLPNENRAYKFTSLSKIYNNRFKIFKPLQAPRFVTYELYHTSQIKDDATLKASPDPFVKATEGLDKAKLYLDKLSKMCESIRANYPARVPVSNAHVTAIKKFVVKTGLSLMKVKLLLGKNQPERDGLGVVGKREYRVEVEMVVGERGVSWLGGVISVVEKK